MSGLCGAEQATVDVRSFSTPLDATSQCDIHRIEIEFGTISARLHTTSLAFKTTTVTIKTEVTRAKNQSNP